MLNKFLQWFESDSPNFINSYGKIMSFYDKESDSFQIEEINNAYIDFKKGEEPNTIYHCWWKIK